jgi:hypothetical protein
VIATVIERPITRIEEWRDPDLDALLRELIPQLVKQSELSQGIGSIGLSGKRLQLQRGKA